MSVHLMEKGLDACLDPDFENRLPTKEIGPFDMTNDVEKNQKEAVDLNKKAMCQFIQAFSTMSLLSKVNLQKKADKLFPSGRAWKLWLELQGDFNPDDSIAETELELALSKLKLTNKKNPRKLLEEIASCEVKYGVPVSDGKKVAQLIRLGGKKYGTVITVTQMCKKSEKVTCTAKHIVDEMWKQWRIEGGKEKGEENADDEDETTLSKVDEKSKHKGKDRSKEKDDKGKKKETRTCNHCQMKGHIEVNCWKKNPSLMPEKFKGKKTEKAGAAVEEEVLLSCIDVYDHDNIILDSGASMMCMQCVDIQDAYRFATIDGDYRFGNVTDEDDIPELEAPTECEDEETVSELRASCASEVRLSNEGHEDHDDDVEPSMSTDEVEVEYEFDNNTAFVQVEFGLEDEDVEETEGLSQIRPTLQALNSPNMWIGDTGATRHSTKYKQGGINSRPSTSKTRGISGQAIKPSMEVDLPGMYCDKSGDGRFAVKLRDVDVIPESHYNLISLTKLMEEGYKVVGTKKDGLSVEKRGLIIKFDIRVETPKGVLWCAYIRRPEDTGEVAAGMSDDNKGDNQPNESVKLNSAIKMSIDRAHAILGHSSEAKTRETAAALGILITRGALKTCESCAISKARQKNVNEESMGEKAVKYNGRVYHDIATVKESEEDKSIGRKTVWHITAEETVNFKRSKFFVAKSDMPKDMCEFMQQEKMRGHPISIIRQDNAGENKKLVTLAHSKEWKLETTFENTARKTPQQNSYAELAFTVIAAKTRAVMNAAQIPKSERFKMWSEAATTVTALDNLIPVTFNGETKTRYEHAGYEIPKFAKYLRTFGEAGIVKNGKDGKVGDRGITMVFVGYADGHAGNCYRMYNPVTSRVSVTRDIIWMGRMYFTNENCEKTKVLPVIAVPITNDVTNEDLSVTEIIKIGLPNSLGREGTEEVAKTDSPSKEGWMTVTTKKGRQSIPPGRYDPTTGKTVSWNVTASDVDVATETEAVKDAGYYDLFNVVDLEEVSLLAMHHMQTSEFANVGAGVGGGFENTKELKVMNYKEAINGPDGVRWQAEVENEYQRMVANKVFEVVLRKDLQAGTKIIDSVWAMKKKSNGTLRGRMNARGFKQVEGQHFDGTTISSPVTNSATIRIVLTLMIMANMLAHVVDVKGAFLHGEFEDGEIIHMKIPQGFEKHFPEGSVLLLKKCLYGLKQAAKAFWRQLLRAASAMGLKRSTADPCLYFKWVNGRLVMMMSWIDDNAIVGQESDIMELKKDLMNQFECEDCGPMDEYVGCTIEKLNTGGIKFRQKVLLQSYRDEFDILKLKKFNTPAAPGTVLRKPDEGDELLTPAKQTQYRSGVGKGMHMMQYSRPDTYNAVRDLARHMTKATQAHYDAMLRMMKYVDDTSDRGLVLNPTRKWDGNKEHEFIISGRSDSDYAKDTQTRKSISGYRVLLEDAPVMFKSSTQKSVALSVCEAEQTAGVLCAQDMLYVRHILESMGLKVKLPMILEMDNMGAVDLANNWSVGGRTRHVDVRQCFLRELKESKILDIRWIKGSENDADAFTKNLDGPAFEKCIRTLVGQDVHMKSYTSEQGGCQEGSQGTQKGIPDFN